MVELSTYGSGEGPGRVTGRGYSTTRDEHGTVLNGISTGYRCSFRSARLQPARA